MSCGRNRTTNSCACAISLSRRVELQFKRERATTMKVLAAFAAVLMLGTLPSNSRRDTLLRYSVVLTVQSNSTPVYVNVVIE